MATSVIHIERLPDVPRVDSGLDEPTRGSRRMDLGDDRVAAGTQSLSEAVRRILVSLDLPEV